MVTSCLDPALTLAYADLARAQSFPPPRSAPPAELMVGDVAVVRTRIQKARAALAKLDHLSPQQRRELSLKVEKAEAALAHFEQLSQRGQARRHATGTLYAAGATLLFDDVTGLGTIDNALLPIIALGLLAVHCQLSRRWQHRSWMVHGTL